MTSVKDTRATDLIRRQHKHVKTCQRVKEITAAVYYRPRNMAPEIAILLSN